MQKIIPPLLKAGDEVRIVAPSRGIKIIGTDSRDLAAKRFSEMGLKVSFGRYTTDDNWDLMGTSPAEQRVSDIMDAFQDPNVKAIFTIIGGFNSNQLLPLLTYDVIRQNPKVFCGFSDITALLNGIYALCGLVTFSGPHYSSFGMLKGFDYTWVCMKNMLLGERKYQLSASPEWSDDLWFIDQENRSFSTNEGLWVIQGGKAEGTIVGGNLGTFVLLNGSPYRPAFDDDTILFVEDCYTSGSDDASFLRELQAVAYQPDFAKVKALVVGRFQKASGMTREKLAYIIKSIPQLDGVPVIANADFGHTTPMATLPIGGYCRVDGEKIMLSVNKD